MWEGWGRMNKYRSRLIGGVVAGSAAIKLLERLRLVLQYFVSVLIFTNPAISEDSIQPLNHPGNRFLRQNLESDVLAHWVGPVGVQLIGISSKQVQISILTEILPLGKAARVDLSILGFPGEMLSSMKADADSRILFIEFDSSVEKLISSGIGNVTKIGEVDVSEASLGVRYILKFGLDWQADGCYSGWSVNQMGEIESFAIAASSSLSSNEMESCFSGLAPLAFGLTPATTLYNIEWTSDTDQKQVQVVFDDRSELILEARAGALCREELNNFTASCPFGVINVVLEGHNRLHELFAE